MGTCYRAHGMKRRADSLAAEAAFRGRLAELGAMLLSPYVKAQARVHVRCASGHDCWIRPVTVIYQGCGVCQICAGHDRETAEGAFRAALEALGAAQLGPYVNNHTRVRARCAEGHECFPLPTHVQRGYGICLSCARQDPVAAEAAFRARIAELGGVVLEAEWLGARTGHHVRCSGGHDCWPMPSNLAKTGRGMCRICAGQDPASAQVTFTARLAAMGATQVGTYVHTHKPVHVRCADGHDHFPLPTNILKGQGVCRDGTVQDVFYVVTHRSDPRVKFGITHGTGAPRLSAHRRGGYTSVVRLATGLTENTAIETERAIRSALALAGEQPVKGREYFDTSCLALILDIADNYLTPAESLPVAS